MLEADIPLTAAAQRRDSGFGQLHLQGCPALGAGLQTWRPLSDITGENIIQRLWSTRTTPRC